MQNREQVIHVLHAEQMLLNVQIYPIFHSTKYSEIKSVKYGIENKTL